MQHAVLKLDGADCSACRHAIMHTGKKIRGITAIFMPYDKQEIHVEYGGNDEAIRQIIQIVNKLGYNAEVKQITAI